MKKLLVVLAVTLMAAMAAQPRLARAELAATAPSGAKIGYVDVNKAMNESLEGKEANAELEALAKKLQGEIDQKTGERDRLKAELDQQWAALSTEARRQKADELDRTESERQKLAAEAQAQLQKREREKLEVIKGHLFGVIAQIGKAENYSIIMPMDAVLYSKDGDDLTKQVVEKMNAKSEKAQENKSQKAQKK